MRILIAYPVPEDILLAILADNIIYRPDLQTKGSRFVGKALTELKPDVLIVQELPSEQAIRNWESAMPDSARFIVQEVNKNQAGNAPQFWFAGVPVFPTVPHAQIHDDIQSLSQDVPVSPTVPHDQIDTDILPLSLAERINTERLVRAVVGNKSDGGARQKASVVLVGAGIVNLITAYYLAEAGYSIAIYDASPDPRESSHWLKYGCTRGGGDARMFTLRENNNYNDKDFTGVDHFNNSYFRTKVSDHGWAICDTNNLSVPEQTWLHEYEAVPQWLANVYNNDIISINHESKLLWSDLIENASNLFQGVELREGIVGLCSDSENYRQVIERHKKAQSLRRVLTPEELTKKYPALADACANGVVAGALELVGFTVNVHKFMASLLEHLEQVGVQCFWNQRITKIHRNDHGEVISLVSGSDPIVADHYVISPGVYGNELLLGTQSENKIQGVLGGWMAIPNLAPKLEHSLKIVRKGHTTEDGNVTVATDSKGQEILIFGSGFGYTGLDPSNILPDELEAMYCGIEDSIKHYFPSAYFAAKQSGLLEASRRYCVRPWTSTSLGVFEVIETAFGGKLIIAGGHNTGGFAESPAIAKAVLASLRGEFHPMHQLYHPNRFASFYYPHSALREAKLVYS